MLDILVVAIPVILNVNGVITGGKIRINKILGINVVRPTNETIDVATLAMSEILKIGDITSIAESCTGNRVSSIHDSRLTYNDPVITETVDEHRNSRYDKVENLLLHLSEMPRLHALCNNNSVSCIIVNLDNRSD